MALKRDAKVFPLVRIAIRERTPNRVAVGSSFNITKSSVETSR